jgi:hypothetical protein
VDSVWDVLHVTSPSQHLKMSGGSYILGKSVHPCTNVQSPPISVCLNVYLMFQISKASIYLCFLGGLNEKRLVTVVVCAHS